MQPTTGWTSGPGGLNPNHPTHGSDSVEISGGDVITAVDGIAVNTYEDLISYIFNKTEIGQTVALTISRESQELTLEMTLAAG